jgi:hypothetical protein
VVARKSRRAEEAENSVRETAPDLSRAVRSPFHDISLKRAVGFKAFLGEAVSTERLKSGAE